ncbi:Uncharacterised protein [Clostridium tetani]|uniref:hypothetical protein n=1 Tax=Clostridium tetani TaxID=1513 RepID=UPI000D1FFAAB|nr:hypothetical protein [Clostridium tetani]AVP54504.1 hypothetical protein C3B72_04940 [Clostridium tetani]RXI75229.1 hypothetical protein DP128_11765 [Clostridium tetani]WFN62899.1 hypothetical protein PAA20_05480 [Clostridium tetani]SUY55106.1 Uncharacterised protein [Clostridium tetani]BDR83503.1 hypothetical protein K254310026_09140 [Clostridium tetani]
MKRLICPKCGNNKSFYREISVTAKLKVNSKEEDLKTIYNIDKNNIDNYFESIYCAKCDAIVRH